MLNILFWQVGVANEPMSERLNLKMCKFVSVVWSVPFGPSNEKYVDHGVGFATPGPAATL